MNKIFINFCIIVNKIKYYLSGIVLQKNKKYSIIKLDNGSSTIFGHDKVKVYTKDLEKFLNETKA